MSLPDRLIEATMKTLAGRLAWLIISLAVIYTCCFLLAELIGGGA